MTRLLYGTLALLPWSGTKRAVTPSYAYAFPYPPPNRVSEARVETEAEPASAAQVVPLWGPMSRSLQGPVSGVPVVLSPGPPRCPAPMGSAAGRSRPSPHPSPLDSPSGTLTLVNLTTELKTNRPSPIPRQLRWIQELVVRD